MKSKILNYLPGDHPWQNQIYWYDTIDSTNTEAKRMAAVGAPHGTVLIAGSQTEGRGRLGRSFLSPMGMGIYLSVILRPACRPDGLMHLTCAAAVAMCDAVEKAAGFRPGIKWTNDLVFGGRKLAGILTELSVDSKTGLIDYAIVGIGINCHQSEADFDSQIKAFAGSLDMFAKESVDRAKLAANMIRSLSEMSCLCQSAALRQYRKDCVTLGKEVSVVCGSNTRHGLAMDIDAEGALVIRFEDGTTEAVNSGEVSIRGMYGYV